MGSTASDPALMVEIDALERLFPAPEAASPDGLVAWGGNLEPLTIVAAYRRGIFPWFNKGDPILWWSPDPRCVLVPSSFVLPARSARKIRASGFSVTRDTAFDQVIKACAMPRSSGAGTWLTPEMRSAYLRLYHLGVAHSVETWRDGVLAGGLYGLAIGRIFFGESMFHQAAEASRFALARLVDWLKSWGFTLIDCQQDTPHMVKMGAVLWPRQEFLKFLRCNLPCEYPLSSNWHSSG